MVVTLEVSAVGYDLKMVSGLDVPLEGEVGPAEVRLSPNVEGEAPKRELVGIGAAIKGDDGSYIIGRVVGGGGVFGWLSPFGVFAVSGVAFRAIGLTK